MVFSEAKKKKKERKNSWKRYDMHIYSVPPERLKLIAASGG